MKRFEFWLSFVCSLAASVAIAATGSSPEFKVDLRGLGPWQRRTAAASEALTYSSAWATNAASGAKAVVKVMPVLKTKPKYLVIDLSGGTNATSYGISYLDEVPGGAWSDEYKTSKLVLRHIPAGSFIMGGRATDYPGAVNTNLHMVTITRDFYMGVFEVTQRQWELVMGTRPSAMANPTCYASRPVDSVSYCDARGTTEGIAWPKIGVDGDSFAGRLRDKIGQGGWDLPTEAQWEYACRAGTTTALNSGENHSSIDSGTEVVKVARCSYNSGVSETGGAYYNMEVYLNSTAEKATAAVGTYQANGFGLFDMHGNVFEWCLDRWSPMSEGSIDPVGLNDTTIIQHVMRGGAWHCKLGGVWCALCSGDRGNGGTGMTQTTRFQTVGFRLCLQGGDVPDLASATTLVNESGAGSQSWSPTRSGTHYLTHSTMNGTTNVQLASAWFEVAGCTLTLEPKGELTNGVMIAITGADEGWTVYYTTNGLAPSKASEPYVGPFSLPESGTVRAVAYNEQGVTSEETMTTFTLHDALSVVGAVARQRYPWNGMVDVDVELKGDEKLKYEVEVEARDLDGGTNLPVRTVYVDAFVSNASDKDGSSSSDAIETIASTGAIVLLPGTHRLTWNADADIAADGEFPRVTVSVKATRQSVIAAYNRSLSIAVDGYTGAEPLTNVPVLVRLSTNITGFAYGDFACPSNGADMAFFDANENELPYEIDEWHTNGESLVWVKLPTMVKGTTFTCAYGNVDAFVSNASDKDGSSSFDAIGTIASTERARMKHEVWAEYAGVWHMNEDSGTAYDSTEHGLDALPNASNLPNGVLAVYGIGAVGRARINADRDECAWMLTPNCDVLKLRNNFTIQGWFRQNETIAYRRLFAQTEEFSDMGWEVETGSYGSTDLNVHGANWSSAYHVSVPTLLNKWVSLSFVFSPTGTKCYANGILVTEMSDVVADGSGFGTAFGSTSNGVGSYFNGQYDEIRLRGGSLSTDRIKADYDMVANRKFCTYGAVKKGAE